MPHNKSGVLPSVFCIRTGEASLKLLYIYFMGLAPFKFLLLNHHSGQKKYAPFLHFRRRLESWSWPCGVLCTPRMYSFKKRMVWCATLEYMLLMQSIPQDTVNSKCYHSSTLRNETAKGWCLSQPAVVVLTAIPLHCTSNLESQP